MKTYTTTTPAITTAEALNALQVLTTYAAQATAHTFRHACRLAHAVREWLHTRHDFSNEEGEILLTGWQYLGIVSGVCLAAVLISCAG